MQGYVTNICVCQRERRGCRTRAADRSTPTCQVMSRFSFLSCLVFDVWGVGFGFWDLGFRVWDLGFGVWGLGFGVWCLVFGVLGLEFGV